MFICLFEKEVYDKKDDTIYDEEDEVIEIFEEKTQLYDDINYLDLNIFPEIEDTLDKFSIAITSIKKYCVCYFYNSEIDNLTRIYNGCDYSFFDCKANVGDLIEIFESKVCSNIGSLIVVNIADIQKN